MKSKVLVTGGAGYIGSHTCKALAASGFEPVTFDDLSRGNRWAVRWGPLIEKDLGDRAALAEALREHEVIAIIHFAAFAYVGESMQHPTLYFRNNVANALNLIDAAVEAGVQHIVASSTCATYGVPDHLPITEEIPLRPINPYGETKVMLEQMLNWYGICRNLNWTALRYFNAAGADPDGDIGEWHDPEPHLLPLVVEAALGLRPSIHVYGTDYDTSDGTAVRDYIHVTDLADAHVRALNRLLGGGTSGAINLGSGIGASVRDVINTIERISGRKIGVIEKPRRSGDPPVLVADAHLARELLGWMPSHSVLDVIARTALEWREVGLPRYIKND